MTIDPVAPPEPSLVRFATPYLEVETPLPSSLERTIRRELAQASHAARRKQKGGDRPSRRVAGGWGTRERSTEMQTMKLTDQQSLRIADLPEEYRVVGVDRSAPFVRKPTGQIMRIEQNGRLTVATIAAKRRLADHRVTLTDRVTLAGGVTATNPYTSVMD